MTFRQQQMPRRLPPGVRQFQPAPQPQGPVGAAAQPGPGPQQRPMPRLVPQVQPQAVKTQAQEYSERYAHIEYEADTLGRVIGVGALRVSQQIRVMEMTPNLEGNTEVGTDKDGNPIVMARRSLPMLAAAVREIDGVKYMFPRNRADLDFMMDRLDGPGLITAAAAAAKLVPTTMPTAPALSEEEEEELEEQEREDGQTA